MKKDVKKFKSVVGQALDELEANPTGYVDAPASDDPFVKVGKVARRLGLKACA